MKQNRRVIARWSVPVLILLLIVAYLVVDFSRSASQRARETVEEQLKDTAAYYAQRGRTELEMLMQAGTPVAGALPDCWERTQDPGAVCDLLYALRHNSSAYMVILSDLEGHAINEFGGTEDVSGEEFFRQAAQNEPAYLLVTETLRDRQAIVSSIPLKEEQETIGYLFLFYPQERFRDMIRKVEFDNLSFYAIVSDDGTVIASVGPPSVFLKDGNLLDALAGADVYLDTYERTRLRMSRLSGGLVGASSGGESRVIAYTPVGINTWHVAIGVNQSYVNRQQHAFGEWTYALLWKLVAALGIFLGLILVSNILARIRSDKQVNLLEDKADMDLLTELNNKIATERKIKEYMANRPQDERGLLFVLDVDNFKKINDTMGHTFGDEVLRSLGLGLKAEFRVSDIVGRTGGDEFMIFLKDIKDEETIRHAISKMELFFKDFKAGDYVKYSVTASIGCARYPEDASSFEALYRAADQALYKAKNRGKNQIARYTEADAAIDLEAEKKKSRT